jgi:hypothetical protein
VKLRKATVAVAAAAMVVGGYSAPAHAETGVRIGVRVSDANGACANKSASNGHVKVCFGAAADKLYVQDRYQDGRSAYGAFGYGDYATCRNPYGVGTWVVCDYDLPEKTIYKYYGFTQDNEGAYNPMHDITAPAYECTTLGGC